jgi:hypothetical protein
VPTPIAPLISGWQRRVGGQPGPWSVASASGVASGGYGPNGLLVELLIDGNWVDITPRVMVRDSGGQITITRGQTAEGQAPSPGTCQFELNNRDGLFSLGNPLSPYYGKIGRNTQIRVSVARGDDKNYRFWGEVPAWPEDWDLSGQDVWVEIEAAGILRRLNQGSTPLRSTMYRGLTSAATATPKAYWPCEDMSQATSIASALGGPSMTLFGSPALASDTGFACSASLPVLTTSSLLGTVPPYPVSGQTQVRFLMYLPAAPADGTQLVRVRTTGGTIPYWAITYSTGGALAIRGLDTDQTTVLISSGGISFNLDNKRVYVSMALTQNGSNVDWVVGVVGTDGSTGQLSNTFSSQTVGRITEVAVMPGQTVTGAVFGHISVQSSVTNTLDLLGQVQAYVGEKAADRIGRLCIEEGVNYVRIGTNSTDAMGPQLPARFMDLLQECVEVDQGILLERETAFGLAYLSRVAMYNLAPRLTLSYPAHQLAAVPRPVPDDQNTRNRVTTTRPSGSSATAEALTGPLSTLAPPAGVGVYPDDPTLNVQLDSALQQHAWWRVHLGTVNEPRYPAMTINLAHPAMATLRNNALLVLFGARVVITAPPGRLGGDISQLVIGIQEQLTHFEHRITFIGQPESPYHIATLDSLTLGRLDTGGSALAGDMTPASGTVLVAAPGALWTTDPAQFPVGATVAGEQVTITGITGASSPQQFTMTRSVNGVVKPHQAGESISLTQPMILGL